MSRKISLRMLLLSVLVCVVVVAIAVGFHALGTRFANAPQMHLTQAPASLQPSTAPADAVPPHSVQGALVRDTELMQRIDALIAASPDARARWSISVRDLSGDRVLYARDAEAAISPASNMKLVTTAAALELLGPDYRWRTSVYAVSNPDANGRIADLYFYGVGAPDLSSVNGTGAVDNLTDLANQLYARGVRHIDGDVIADETYFNAEAYGDGWLWTDLQWYFGSEVSALSINSNSVVVRIAPDLSGSPARVELVPSSDYFNVENQTSTVARDAPSTLGINRGLSNNDIRLWGEVPSGSGPLSVRLSVHHPARWAASLMLAALRARGITVSGVARMIDRTSRIDKRLNTTTAVELAAVESAALADIVRRTNKFSLNLEAELLFRTIGRHLGQTAPDPDAVRMLMRGDDMAAAAVVKQWLAQKGIATENISIHDGSGLSRLDLVTADAITRLLSAEASMPTAIQFRESLPLAGVDGTLATRLTGPDTVGRVRAKTGTLTGINSLSGYINAANGRTTTFSIICNDDTNGGSTQTIDALATLLAKYQSLP